MIIDRKAVPALMFHSVGMESYAWAWPHIAESLESFEQKIALLARKGFTGVFWSELYDHMAGRRTLPGKSIFLTFDDGYLDNWVYVYPILKKYGMKGTIFVTTDFVDPGEELRFNLDDVASGRCQRSDLRVAGFLNWHEMQKMEASGLMDIQSHAKTHTWYFSGPKVVDLHRHFDINPYPWLFWNARPERKPFYLNEDQQHFLPCGYPILEHQKSLAVRRFRPEKEAMSKVTDFVARHGGHAFMANPDADLIVKKKIQSLWSNGCIPGRYESDDERLARLTDELSSSKQLLEKHLSKQIEYLCWPGGGNDELAQSVARKAGYKSWTLASASDISKSNRPGEDPASIRRISTSNVIGVRGRNCGTGGKYFQYAGVMSYRGSVFHRLFMKAYKLAALTVSMGGAK